ncbi:hypothetical protein BC834DRAFT_130517 [Gloeopeniophorella convolvens]|nr:hypothetical protein BC834DRAFT_130517 [Gloeopeniophorella convolvens]
MTLNNHRILKGQAHRTQRGICCQDGGHAPVARDVTNRQDDGGVDVGLEVEILEINARSVAAALTFLDDGWLTAYATTTLLELSTTRLVVLGQAPFCWPRSYVRQSEDAHLVNQAVSTQEPIRRERGQPLEGTFQSLPLSTLCCVDAAWIKRDLLPSRSLELTPCRAWCGQRDLP